MIEVNIITVAVRGILIAILSIPHHSTIRENGNAAAESRHGNLAGRIGRRGDAHGEF
jgi:mannose/fructose/N-acetylgalactosamine-specific phosphotransferase system component IIC